MVEELYIAALLHAEDQWDLDPRRHQRSWGSMVTPGPPELGISRHGLGVDSVIPAVDFIGWENQWLVAG